MFKKLWIGVLSFSLSLTFLIFSFVFSSKNNLTALRSIDLEGKEREREREREWGWKGGREDEKRKVDDLWKRWLVLSNIGELVASEKGRASVAYVCSANVQAGRVKKTDMSRGRENARLRQQLAFMFLGWNIKLSRKSFPFSVIPAATPYR